MRDEIRPTLVPRRSSPPLRLRKPTLDKLESYRVLYKQSLKESPLLRENIDENGEELSRKRDKLAEIYDTYKRGAKELTEMQEGIAQLQPLQHSNSHLTQELARMQEMLKDILLAREKKRIADGLSKRGK